MKKYICIILVLIFSNCAKDPFETYEIEKVWENTSIDLVKLKSEILENKNGWEFFIQGKGNKSVHYGFFNFQSESAVDFVCDLSSEFYTLSNSAINFENVESNAAIKFPATSRLAQLANSASNIDSVYVVKNLKEDTIFFEGENTRSILKLIKGKPEKLGKIKNNSISQDKEGISMILNFPRFFFHIKYQNIQFDLEIDTLQKTFNIRKNNGKRMEIDVHRYYFNGEKIKFLTPLKIMDKVFPDLKLKSINNNEAFFEEGLKITNESKPIFYDHMPINTFEGTVISWAWGSRTGFSQRAKDDIAKLRNIKDFDRLIINPRFDTDTVAKQDYGFLGILLKGRYTDGSDFPIVTITADKLMKFNKFRLASPVSDNRVKESKEIYEPYLYNSVGFYIIQMQNGYYMVDARDALTWVYFQLAMS